MPKKSKPRRRSLADALAKKAPAVTKAERALIASAHAGKRGTKAQPKVQLGVRIPPETMARLQVVSQDRRDQGQDIATVQDIVTDAIETWLDQATGRQRDRDLPQLLREAAAAIEKRK